MLQSAHKPNVPELRENLAALLAPVGGFLGFGLLANEADLQLFAVYSFEKSDRLPEFERHVRTDGMRSRRTHHVQSLLSGAKTAAR